MNDVVIRTDRVVYGAVLACLLIQVVLLLLDIVFNLVDITGDRSIQRIVNPAREASLPTWFASTQAIAVAVVAAVVAWISGVDGQRKRMFLWAFVAAFFCYIGMDDAAEIHERLSSAIVRGVGEDSALSRLPTYAWQALIGPFLALGLLTSAGVIAWSGSRAVRLLIVVALGVFAVSQGLDAVEGMPDTEGILHAYAEAHGFQKYTMTHLPRLLEESLEMLATTGFLAGALSVARSSLMGRSVWLVAGADGRSQGDALERQ